MDPDVRQLAARFLDFVYKATRLPMIVCDEGGRIVCAVDRSRIGVEHAGAQRILRGEASEVFVTAEDAARDPTMKEGCNVPITIEGKRVGTFGLAGPLEVAQPVTRISAAMLVSWVDERRRQEALSAAASRVLEGVKHVSARVASVSGEAAEVEGLMVAATSEARTKIERSHQIVRSVGDIAQKSRILSINGSVEASRAGELGRAFAVVAREMLALAQDARGAANGIQTTLGEVEAAVGRLEGAMKRSSALARSQTDALTDVQGVVNELQKAVAELARGSGARASP